MRTTDMPAPSCCSHRSGDCWPLFRRSPRVAAQSERLLPTRPTVKTRCYPQGQGRRRPKPCQSLGYARSAIQSIEANRATVAFYEDRCPVSLSAPPAPGSGGCPPLPLLDGVALAPYLGSPPSVGSAVRWGVAVLSEAPLVAGLAAFSPSADSLAPLAVGAAVATWSGASCWGDGDAACSESPDAPSGPRCWSPRDR